MVGVLYTAGFVSLQELQTGNQMQNAEGVFFAMADSFEELQEGQAPKRAGSLDLDVGASLAVVNETTIEVEVNNATDTVHAESFHTQSMEYRLDERAVSYEAGAVFRSNKGQSAMVREPTGIFCSNTTGSTNTTVVSIVSLVDPDGASVAAGTATVTGHQRSSRLRFPTSRNRSGTLQNVTIDVTSPREAAWNEHLRGDWSQAGGGEFVCRDVGQVFVRHTVIVVRVSS